MSGLLDYFKPSSPDKKREAICAHLNSIGVEAHLRERGAPEELFRESQERSLGLIHISNQVLDWVNVAQGLLLSPRKRHQYYYRSPPQTYYYRIWYGVRDPNLKTLKESRFHSKRHRSLWLLGPAVGVTWEDDFEHVYPEPLSSDDALKRSLMKECVDVEVMGFPDGYWIISNRVSARLPSRSLWECYQGVAQGLLQHSTWPNPVGR